LKSSSNILSRFFDFIGYSNLFLAFAVFCSTLQGSFIFEDAFQSCFVFAIVNFIAAFFLYNAQRIYQSFKPTTDIRLLWYRKNKKYIYTIAILLLILFGRLLFYTVEIFTEGIIVYVLAGLLSLIYFLPPFELRRKPFLKIFYISLVWILVCFVVPFLFKKDIYTGTEYFQRDQWLYLVSQFCFIAATCVPFDIRDVEKDRNEGVKSIPVLIGVRNTKILGIVFLLIYLVIAFFIETKDLVGIRGLVFAVSGLVIWFAQPGRHRYYFIYLSDGLIILHALLLAIFL